MVLGARETCGCHARVIYLSLLRIVYHAHALISVGHHLLRRVAMDLKILQFVSYLCDCGLMEAPIHRIPLVMIINNSSSCFSDMSYDWALLLFSKILLCRVAH